MPKEKVITVIDIGSFKICTVIASLGEEGGASVIGVSNVPSKGIKKGVVVNIDEAVESISTSLEKAQRMSGHPVSSALVTVNGSHIESINSHGVVAVSHQDAEISSEDVSRVTEAAQAVSLPSSREIIHVIPRDFVVDGQDGIHDPLGMSGVRLEVETNLIHGSTTAIKNLAKCVSNVGVNIEDLIYTGLSSSGAVLTDTEKELGTILLDIGGGTTSLILYSDGSPVYSSVLPIGGQNITNDLAVGLRTSLTTAEKIKLKLSREESVLNRTMRPSLERHVDKEETKKSELDVAEFNLEVETISRKLLSDIMKERMRELFTLVAIEVKKANYMGKLPAGVVITGGASETYDMIRIAKEVLKMPGRIGKPRGITGLIEEIEGPAFSASVGGILYGIGLESEPSKFSSVAKGRVSKVVKGITSWFKSFLP